MGFLSCARCDELASSFWWAVPMSRVAMVTISMVLSFLRLILMSGERIFILDI